MLSLPEPWGSSSGQGTKILQAMWHSQQKKKNGLDLNREYIQTARKLAPETFFFFFFCHATWHAGSQLPALVVQWLSCVWLFVTLWTAASQASLFFTSSWSLLKFMFIESVMPSNYLILCRPLSLLPSIFSQHQGLLQWVGSLHQVAKGLELQYQSFQWIFRVDFL